MKRIDGCYQCGMVFNKRLRGTCGPSMMRNRVGRTPFLILSVLVNQGEALFFRT
jgi:hypothetical protein